MTEAEIQYRIRSCETQRNECQKKIRLYEQQYDELSMLRDRFASLQDDFVARQRQQLSALSAASKKALSLRAARSYVDSMRTLIGGSEFERANRDLDTAANRVLEERKRTQERLNAAEQAYQKACRDLQYWREQLRLLRAEAQEVR